MRRKLATVKISERIIYSPANRRLIKALEKTAIWDYIKKIPASAALGLLWGLWHLFSRKESSSFSSAVTDFLLRTLAPTGAAYMMGFNPTIGDVFDYFSDLSKKLTKKDKKEEQSPGSSNP